MAEFDYKQTPFRKTLTDAEYDLAVGRASAPLLSNANCSKCGCAYVTIACSNCGTDLDTTPPTASRPDCSCGKCNPPEVTDAGYYPEML